MELAPTKTRLLAQLAEAHGALASLTASAGESERQARGTLERWALKDLVFHVGIWEARQAEQLALAARGETPPTYANYLEVNDRDFVENRDRPWEDVCAEAERGYQALIAQVDAYSEDMLTDRERVTWHQGRPISTMVRGTGYWHTFAHLAQYAFERGDVATANRIQETLAATLGAPGEPTDERGAALYNLACYYATTGQPEQAVARLPGAFVLRPDLVAWAAQDTDLDALRERPDYRVLMDSLAAKDPQSPAP